MSNLVKYDYKRLTPFKWFVLENFPFIEADFDAITNYQLYCKVVEYLNKTIDSMNQTGEVVEEFTQKFIDLQNYVDNYFKNLDVQEEINNKLDNMAQDGTLQNIILNYLKLNGVLAYENVETMKNNTLIQENNLVKTFGYYSKDDGGECEYYITSNKINDLSIQLNNGLYANPFLVEPINVKKVGINKNNASDIINLLLSLYNTIEFPTDNYTFTEPIIINKDNIEIIGNNSIFNYSGTGDFIKNESNHIVKFILKDLTINGNKNSICLNFDNILNDSKFSNIKINNFKIGLKMTHCWCNYFELIRIINCDKSFEFLSQVNAIEFNSCSFVNSTETSLLTNCEGINFINCNIANNKITPIMRFYQSGVNFIGCYYENLFKDNTFEIGSNETYYSVINIYGGKITDDYISIFSNEGIINITEIYLKRIKIIDRYTTIEDKKSSCGKNMHGLQLPNTYYSNRFNSNFYFDGSFDVSFARYGAGSLIQNFENALKTLQYVENNYYGIQFNLEIGKKYLLFIECELPENNNFIFLQPGQLSTTIKPINNKIIVPITAYTESLRIRWETTEPIKISKCILQEI